MIKQFMGFEPMWEEDDGLNIPESAETGEEEMESAEPSNEEGEEEVESAALPEKSDATFAQMRRELEEARRKEQEYAQKEKEWNEQRDMYDKALGNWFDGDHKAEQAIAYFDEVPLEEVIGNINQRKELEKLYAEKEELQARVDQFDFDNRRASDLKEIKEAHPDAKINDVLELGEEYFQLRAMGIPATTVYEGMELKKGIPPKPIGKAKTSTPSKTFVTRDEVEAMSSKERVKNYDLIRKSMTKW